MVMKSEKKEYEHIRIISLDGSYLFGETKPSAVRNGKKKIYFLVCLTIALIQSSYCEYTVSIGAK